MYTQSLFVWILSVLVLMSTGVSKTHGSNAEEKPCTEEEDELLPKFLEDDDEVDCPTGAERWLQVKQIPWGLPNRAFLTFPPEVKLSTSTIPGAGRGVFAATFIPRHTWLGEYEGELVKDEDSISDYAWTIWRDSKIDYFVDAFDERTSNWIRWINCARHVKEESIVMAQCRGKVYYYTKKDIYPGQELFVYYGHEYARDQLDIQPLYFYNLSVDINLYKQYACWEIE